MIRDYDHARHLVAIGEATADMARTSQQATDLQCALEARLHELGNCETIAAIEEGKYLCAELETLNADWGDPESPECLSHLY